MLALFESNAFGAQFYSQQFVELALVFIVSITFLVGMIVILYFTVDVCVTLLGLSSK